MCPLGRSSEGSSWSGDRVRPGGRLRREAIVGCGHAQEALGLFSTAEIAEAFAATRGITVPSQLRAEIRKDSRDLVGAFRTLAPARAPIRIQRWGVRRLAVTVGVLLGAAIAVSLVRANLTTVGLR